MPDRRLAPCIKAEPGIIKVKSWTPTCRLTCIGTVAGVLYFLLYIKSSTVFQGLPSDAAFSTLTWDVHQILPIAEVC